MTTEHEVSRTLVKSPPELWAECSNAAALARHLGEFGEITITRLEPEATVAWEGERASGTVRIEPSGWGTRVTLTAQTAPVASAAAGEPSPGGEVPPAHIAEPHIHEPPPETSGSCKDRAEKEETHATVEETLENEDPAPVSETGAFRIRWRRMSNRMRGLFRASEAEETGEPEAPVAEEPGAQVADGPGAPAAEEPEAQVPDEPEGPVAEERGDAADSDASSPEAAAESHPDPEVILTAALDSLGQAHHRPFSRA